MKEKTCCFTGHREIECSKNELCQRLDEAISTLIEEGYTDFVAGGAIGFDTLAAKAVLKHKKTSPDIKLHIVIPCKDQDKYWNLAQKLEYKNLLKKADSTETLFDSYNRFCMFKRNEKMVDMSSVVISYYNGSEKGGTAMTVRYAVKKGLKIINIF